MPDHIDNLRNLPEATVTQARARLIGLLHEYLPDLDLKRGVVHDLVLHVSAVLTAALEERIARVRKSCSLAEAAARPDLVSEELVERAAANLRVIRRSGAAASGQLTIVLSEAVPVSIGANVEFTVGSRIFRTRSAFSAKVSPEQVVSDSDRLLVAMDDGRFGFDVDVTAAQAGEAGNVSRGAIAVPSVSIPKFVKAYVKADFSGGRDPETTRQLAARALAGASARAWSNRACVEGLIRGQDEFADLKAISIIGCGDPEMARDRRSLWPGSMGGRVDVYVRSQALWRATSIIKTAVLVDRTGATGLWQLSLGRDDAPGFYEIEKVQLVNSEADSSGFSPASDVRSHDLTVDADHVLVPDIVNTRESAYTAYQTSIIRFYDTVTDASSLIIGASTRPYRVVVRSMPRIAELQRFLSARDVRPPMSDVLVKAAIPCFVSILATVIVRQGHPLPSAARLREEVARAVNELGYVDRLSSSLVSAVIHAQVGPALLSVTGLDMIGRLRRPDGTELLLHDAVVLVLPQEPASMVSGRTVVFLCAPQDVSISVVSA